MRVHVQCVKFSGQSAQNLLNLYGEKLRGITLIDLVEIQNEVFRILKARGELKNNILPNIFNHFMD